MFEAGLKGECATGLLLSTATSTITVRWTGGEGDGKIKFKVKEKGSVNLSVSTELSVKYPPAATSITRSGSPCSASKTYTANFPTGCPRIIRYRWTLNGSAVGETFSPSINLSVPINQGATVGVEAIYADGRSLRFSQYFGPSSLASATIEGPGFLCKGSTTDYFLSGVILGSVNWSVSNPASIDYQMGESVGIYMPDGNHTADVTLIATGVNNCNVSFSVSRSLSIPDKPCQVLQPDTIETRLDEPAKEERIVIGEIEAYPTLLSSGQYIQVNLPETDEQATPYLLTVLGNDGKTLQENKHTPGRTTISTTLLSPGNYILRIKSINDTKVFRFVIIE